MDDEIDPEATRRAPPPMPPPPPPGGSTERDLVPGVTLGRVLGRGASAVVYRGRQRLLDRDVAVKVLNIDLSSPPMARRFEAECRTLGRLSGHPAIVDVLAAGVTPGGLGFVVMPYYRNGTLADRVGPDGLPYPQVLVIAARLCSALGFSHRNGVIHRDLKPENVLLDEDGEVYLSDFGLAAQDGETGHRTRSIAFTRDHVAPEVLRDNGYGVASDVFSLSSTLYTLLAGTPPYTGGNELLQLAAITTTPFPAHRLAGVPAALVEALRTAMDPEPGRRFRTVEEFGRALAAVPAEIPVPDQRPRPPLPDASLLSEPPARPPNAGPHQPAAPEPAILGPVASGPMDLDPPTVRATDLDPPTVRAVGTGIPFAPVGGAPMTGRGPARTSTPVPAASPDTGPLAVRPGTGPGQPHDPPAQGQPAQGQPAQSQPVQGPSATVRPGSSRPLTTVAGGMAIVVVVAAGAYAWSRTRFSLDEQAGQVVLRHGIPATVAGLALFDIQSTGLRPADLGPPDQALLRSHQQLIGASDARALVADLWRRSDLCRRTLAEPRCPAPLLRVPALTAVTGSGVRGNRITLSWTAVETRTGATTTLTVNGARPPAGCPAVLTGPGSCAFTGGWQHSYRAQARVAGSPAHLPAPSSVSVTVGPKPR